jgi:O-antigen/teichoic acid export membrane protein
MVTLTSQGSLFLIQLISTTVLARFLTLADFALIAMVTAIGNLATPFADLDLSQATIQRNVTSCDEINALFGLMQLSDWRSPF